jgi:hypothetical protein
LLASRCGFLGGIEVANCALLSLPVEVGVKFASRFVKRYARMARRVVLLPSGLRFGLGYTAKVFEPVVGANTIDVDYLFGCGAMDNQPRDPVSAISLSADVSAKVSLAVCGQERFLKGSVCIPLKRLLGIEFPE